MSSNHRRIMNSEGYSSNSREIDHTSYLSEHFASLYGSGENSDVTLIVNGKHFPAHKTILACRSEYFRAMFFGGLKETSQAEVILNSTNWEAFKPLLNYLYTGRMSLSNVEVDHVIEILRLANQYSISELESALGNHLLTAITVENCCVIYEVADLFALTDLQSATVYFISLHTKEVLENMSYLNLPANAFKNILSMDSFYGEEMEIFQAVVLWLNENKERVSPSDKADVLSAVRLNLISVCDLLESVRPANIFSSDAILDAISVQTFYNSKESTRQIRHRGLMRPGINLATEAHDAVVTEGNHPEYLLNGETDVYDMEAGYTCHDIQTGSNPGVVGGGDLVVGSKRIAIRLGTQSIVNCIRMLLWDSDIRSYSYYIEVSVDQIHWERVIDHSNHHCRSWQNLRFETRVVRYVRIVGTNNTVNKLFHLVSFEIMLCETPVGLYKGIVEPIHNVAQCRFSARVIEGVSRVANSLLDGCTTGYNWDNGYTCHQLGSGNILIQLGQPYVIGSMRLLLWDCDSRSYSYYIETSVNLWDWEIVVDKTKEECKSWQVLSFEKRPVVFVRITGTRNTHNEVFHCVHFECPAQINQSDVK